MTTYKSRQKQAKLIRIFRKAHRITGASLFFFFFLIAVTGILLGWKNHSNGYILPQTTKGSTSDLSTWLPLDALQKNANQILHDSISMELSLELDRIDIRKDNGIVKFVFENHLWEVQLDGGTGALLSLGKRHSDFIENIHDGTLLDSYFNTSSKQIKVIYTSVMGSALLLFTITGFWLWYGPKRMKRIKRKQVN